MPETAVAYSNKKHQKENRVETKLLLVRHGQSEANTKKYFAGHLDAPLTETGRRQAEKMAEYVKSHPVSAIYASDLSRAYDTALPIGMRLDLPVRPDTRLREICAGEWQGRGFDYLYQNADYNVWLTGSSSVFPSGGESIPDLFLRADAFLTDILHRHEGETVAVVTHATPIRVLKAKWLGIPISAIVSVASPPNASVTLVNCKKDGTGEILMEGENRFLGALAHAATTKM